MKFQQYHDEFMASGPSGSVQSGVSPGATNTVGGHLHEQLVAELRGTYGKTALWLGPEIFHKLALDYVEWHASTPWTPHHYHRHFVDYLAIAFQAQTEVGELAWLERALHEAFSASTAQSVMLDELDAEDWEQVEFEFVPTLRIRRLQSNAPVIWSGLGHDTRPTARVGPLGGGVRVWRSSSTARFTTIGSEEYACLELALAGGTFGELCTWLAGVVGDSRVAQIAGTTVQAWASDGLIAGIRDKR